MFKKDNRKKIVFLGTPEVAAKALEILLREASSLIQIVLVVSQPPARSTRHANLIKSPVHELALQHGIPVLTPETAKDSVFLNDLAELQPDLCITAAYGNYLPAAFLSIPKFGTLNIHPSLLPLYRGAAPVQRSIENGDQTTGVSILYTVSKMDAGPIVAQEFYDLSHEIKSMEALQVLFEKGAKLLVSCLKKVFLGSIEPLEQDESRATHAAKIRPEEGVLDFSLPAERIHNKVRAFAQWPGTKATLFIDQKPTEIKVITTETQDNQDNIPIGQVVLDKHAIQICCGDGRILKILELQMPGKKPLTARDFQNGIRGKIVKIS